MRPGDGILVPSGTAHFIGEGILVTELQEPTDLSILLEWDGFAVDGDAEGHLGLGFDVALDALDLTVWSDDDVARAVRRVPWPRPVGPALPEAALPYFRADWLAAPENPFAVRGRLLRVRGARRGRDGPGGLGLPRRPARGRRAGALGRRAVDARRRRRRPALPPAGPGRARRRRADGQRRRSGPGLGRGGDGGSLGAGPDAELDEDAAHVVLDGLGGEEQPSRDLAVGVAAAQTVEDLGLACA